MTEKQISKLSDAMRQHAGHKMTPDEIREQRVSFIMGTIHRDSDLTREEVRELIMKRDGTIE